METVPACGIVEGLAEFKDGRVAKIVGAALKYERQ